ncbi:IS1193, transposase, ISL3 family [Streptococcus pneumoniae]|nr:IS1193, transposase, ISL3 family [Streptococcus pneumoniae]
MEQLKNTTDLLGLEDKNIKILSVLKYQTHLVVQAKLDSPAPPCPHCQGKMIKYDFQKASKIPLLDCQGLPTVLHLKKRRFQCKNCLKVVVSQTSIVKKNCQISNMVRQKIAQLLLEKQSMTEIAHRLAVSTSTVIRKLREFKFETDWTKLPKVMSWDEYSFKKSKMSFIAQDFESKSILAILDGRTHAVIRNHFQRYQREVRELVEVITMDMYSPYYRLLSSSFQRRRLFLTASTLSNI